ncbi:uncharacterized protein LOC107266607 isoform X2 [Cephus cinctus]|uniref:Uncharacterized protein LOC107266607 isoform X2 n=1 Tax=Cephus cinctus TaxID=211228 RepID=A0AAJ7W074_CEPCN|nr:uncharacterized protein LOC107266607 isoform X2 [Cephus cinctus]
MQNFSMSTLCCQESAAPATDTTAHRIGFHAPTALRVPTTYRKDVCAFGTIAAVVVFVGVAAVAAAAIVATTSNAGAPIAATRSPRQLPHSSVRVGPSAREVLFSDCFFCLLPATCYSSSTLFDLLILNSALSSAQRSHYVCNEKCHRHSEILRQTIRLFKRRCTFWKLHGIARTGQAISLSKG